MKIKALILIMRKWRDRAYLRGQLIEEGLRTLAVRSLDDAREWLDDPEVKTVLIIYDTLSQDSLERDFKFLTTLASEIPVLVLTSSFQKGIVEPKLKEFKYIMKRPFSIGEVVSRVKDILSYY